MHYKLTLNLVICSLLTVGCSTNRVIGEGTRELFSKTQSNYEWITLVEDDVLAFGIPATPILNEPNDSILVAGKKYSYLINKGGVEFFNLLSQLDPQYIQIDRELSFRTPSVQSQKFTGNFRFSYNVPNRELTLEELSLFHKYGVQLCDCSNVKNQHIKTFDIEIGGKVYPVVKNISSLKPLSKPYSIKIETLEYKTRKMKLTTSDKLEAVTLLPVTLIADLIVLPSKLMGIIYQP